MTDDAPFFTGQTLLALPGMDDPRFRRSVIAIVDHGPDGALGIALHQPHQTLLLRDVLEQLDLLDGATCDADLLARPVLVGGPVDTDRGFLLDGGAAAEGRWQVAVSRDALAELASSAAPKHWDLALGYAGWGPGQLEAEFALHAWHAGPVPPSLLLDVAPQRRWDAAMAALGIDPRLLAPGGGTA